MNQGNRASLLLSSQLVEVRESVPPPYFCTRSKTTLRDQDLRSQRTLLQHQTSLQKKYLTWVACLSSNDT